MHTVFLIVSIAVLIGVMAVNSWLRGVPWFRCGLRKQVHGVTGRRERLRRRWYVWVVVGLGIIAVGAIIGPSISLTVQIIVPGVFFVATGAKGAIERYRDSRG